MKIKVGCRGSKLSIRQTEEMLQQLIDRHPDVEYEIVVLQTRGDLDRHTALQAFGGKGIFIREIEEALVERRIDCAVHSLKDMPSEVAEGTCLLAPPRREEPGDVLVCRPGLDVSRRGLRIGTGSIRRRVFLEEMFDHPQIVPIRGNIETRIRKMEELALDGVVLAGAGLRRLGLLRPEYIPLDPKRFLPAPNQGILALQIRSDDERMRRLFGAIADEETALVMRVERSIQEAIGAGCHSPLALYTEVRSDVVEIFGAFGDPEGKRLVRAHRMGSVDDALALAGEIARELRRKADASPKVYLVGAGIGAYDLLTLRAKALLDRADVIVHDRLIGADVAEHWPKAERIDVGKRAGCHPMPQEAIEALLERLALEGKTVVRLKGGDPYVFGRGAEEALYLRGKGIDVEVVPGVTSGVVAPMFAGIPVTHRDFAESVSFITGHRREGVDADYSVYARLPGTLVFFMALSHAKTIAEHLCAGGLPKETPAAIIFSGATPAQEVVVTTLENLAEDVAPYRDRSPAMIVVGNVVSLRDGLNFFEERPLFGARVLVMRSRAQASEIAVRLRSLGAEVLERPLLTILPTGEKALEERLRDLRRYRGVIFTSANAVGLVMDRLIEMEDIRALAGLDVVSVGAKTSEALRKYGIRADLQPKTYDGDALIEMIRGRYRPGETLLYPHSTLTRSEMIEGLRSVADIDSLSIYENVPGDAAPFGHLDYAIFSSSSTVRRFVESYGAASLAGVKILSIGKHTSRAIAECGLELFRQSPEATFDSMIQCMEEDYAHAHAKNSK